MRMIQFMNQLRDSAKICVFNERANTIYRGTVGEAPKKAWFHRDVDNVVWNIFGEEFMVSTSKRHEYDVLD